MSRKHASITVVFALLFFYLMFPFPARAGTPTDQVRGTVDNVLGILKNPSLKADSRKRDRRDQLRRAVFSRFDFAEMAKRSLGSYWRQLTSKEQDDFVRLYTDLLERAYVDQIESYNNEKFAYVKETVDQEYADVQSRIVTTKGDEYSLNYRVHLVGSEWKVYDLVIENISLVNNYRSQFNRIIANSSYNELLRRMRDKQIEIRTERK